MILSDGESAADLAQKAPAAAKPGEKSAEKAAAQLSQHQVE